MNTQPKITGLFFAELSIAVALRLRAQTNSVATPVMQSLKSPVAPGEPGWPSIALEQTKNRLMW